MHTLSNCSYMESICFDFLISKKLTWYFLLIPTAIQPFGLPLSGVVAFWLIHLKDSLFNSCRLSVSTSTKIVRSEKSMSSTFHGSTCGRCCPSGSESCLTTLPLWFLYFPFGSASFLSFNSLRSCAFSLLCSAVRSGLTYVFRKWVLFLRSFALLMTCHLILLFAICPRSIRELFSFSFLVTSSTLTGCSVIPSLVKMHETVFDTVSLSLFGGLTIIRLHSFAFCYFSFNRNSFMDDVRHPIFVILFGFSLLFLNNFGEWLLQLLWSM